MLKVNDLVEIATLYTEGRVVGVVDDEVLVQHDVEIDGRRKTINQWYSISIVKKIGQIQDKSDEKVESKFFESKGLTVELGVIPQTKVEYNN